MIKITTILALFAVALAAPMAQAKTVNSSERARYGLDPWAYNVIHRSGQSVALITEHSAGQNRPGKAATEKYVALDPIIANAVRNHSRGQIAFSKAAASVPAATSTGFDWGDAGIGAGIAFGAVVFALGLARLIPRYSRTHLAGP
jgi:hypothetical protein